MRQSASAKWLLLFYITINLLQSAASELTHGEKKDSDPVKVDNVDWKELLSDLRESWQSPLLYLEKRGYLPAGNENLLEEKLNELQNNVNNNKDYSSYSGGDNSALGFSTDTGSTNAALTGNVGLNTPVSSGNIGSSPSGASLQAGTNAKYTPSGASTNSVGSASDAASNHGNAQSPSPATGSVTLTGTGAVFSNGETLKNDILSLSISKPPNIATSITSFKSSAPSAIGTSFSNSNTAISTGSSSSMGANAQKPAALSVKANSESLPNNIGYASNSQISHLENNLNQQHENTGPIVSAQESLVNAKAQPAVPSKPKPGLLKRIKQKVVGIFSNSKKQDPQQKGSYTHDSTDEDLMKDINLDFNDFKFNNLNQRRAALKNFNEMTTSLSGKNQFLGDYNLGLDTFGDKYQSLNDFDSNKALYNGKSNSPLSSSFNFNEKESADPLKEFDFKGLGLKDFNPRDFIEKDTSLSDTGLGNVYKKNNIAKDDYGEKSALQGGGMYMKEFPALSATKEVNVNDFNWRNLAAPNFKGKSLQSNFNYGSAKESSLKENDKDLDWQSLAAPNFKGGNFESNLNYGKAKESSLRQNVKDFDLGSFAAPNYKGGNFESNLNYGNAKESSLRQNTRDFDLGSLAAPSVKGNNLETNINYGNSKQARLRENTRDFDLGSLAAPSVKGNNLETNINYGNSKQARLRENVKDFDLGSLAAPSVKGHNSETNINYGNAEESSPKDYSLSEMAMPHFNMKHLDANIRDMKDKETNLRDFTARGTRTQNMAAINANTNNLHSKDEADRESTALNSRYSLGDKDEREYSRILDTNLERDRQFTREVMEAVRQRTGNAR